MLLKLQLALIALFTFLGNSFSSPNYPVNSNELITYSTALPFLSINAFDEVSLCEKNSESLTRSVLLAPPPPPGNDDPCSATVLTVGATCSFSTYTNALATASAGVPAPGCANYLGGDVWFRIVVPASGNIAVDMNTGVVTDGGMAIYSGTCGSLALLACDDDNSANGLMPFLQLTGQTPGASLWIRVWEYGNDSNGTFSICAYNPSVAGAPANDNPCSATPLTVNTSCSFNTYTNAGATATSGVTAPGCANYLGGDVWFTVTVPASGNVAVDMNTGVITDAGMAIYSGSCASLTLLACDDDGSVNGAMSYLLISGQTPGSTLWIRVWEYGNDNNGTFSICAFNPIVAPPPANDNCTGATSVTVPVSGCNSVAGSIAGATMSSQANGCSGTANDDVWYSFVATSAGASINLNNVAGTTTDLYHSVYAGTCGAPGAALVCSDPNSSTLTGLTIGNTYFVRIFSYGSTSAQTTTFDLCIQATGPCGTPNNQDYCVAPAQLTQGPGNFSSNTSGTYTQDQPGNLSTVFCGSIENNSWYQFTATSTTHNFPITSVTGCTFGIQAQVYNVTEDINGCCLNFASVSNCYNPANLTLGTVAATGLTIGQTYVLMVDGNGGAICDFTISGWSAVGILPVELTDFTGISFDVKNVLTWITASERENDHFNVLRSSDGVNFEKIGTVPGAGNSSQKMSYSFQDFDVKSQTSYYRLEQVDYNGTNVKSDIITLTKAISEYGILSAWPNPAKDILTVEINNQGLRGKVVLMDVRGTIQQEILLSEAGYQSVSFDLSEVSSGLYYVLYTDVNGTTSSRKITKH